MLDALWQIPQGEISRYGFYALTLFGIFVLWRLHKNTKNRFSVLDFVADPKTGKGDRFALAYVGAFLVSLWVLWYLTITGGLSEWFYTIFVGAFVLGGLGGRAIGVWQSKMSAPPPPPEKPDGPA